MVNEFNGKVLGEEQADILKRFSRVFEQAYIRFLDLKKAEAQAREAQIQLCLERVRARAMAMHASEELAETAALLFKQVEELGIPLWSSGFQIWNEDDISTTAWMSTPEGGIQAPFRLPHTEDPFFREILDARERGKDFLVFESSGASLEETYRYMHTLLGVREMLGDIEASGFTLPTFQVTHCGFFPHGYLMFITRELYPEAADIFGRFTHAFEQTYTRFLDLKKAEAQAREAQIEAALERVRSRAMAMHKADELVEVTLLLRKEMGRLGVEELETSSIYIHDETTGKTECWYSIQDRNDEQNLISDHMTIDLQDTWVGRQMQAFYRSGDLQTSIVMQGANRTEWITYCAEQSDLFSAEEFYGAEIPERTYHLYRFDNGYMGAAAPGEISAESWDLLKRATAVFSLAYTRFNDLRKAEAQAREARIEAALERVRSRAMAMQESADLLDIVVRMRAEFVALGHEAHYFWHMRWLPDRYEKAMTSGDGARIGMVMELPRHIHGDIPLLAEWEKSDAPTVVYAMDADAAVDYVHKMITLGDFEQVDPSAPTLEDVRHIGGLTFIMARTTHGEIGYSLPGVVPDVPEADLATLVRFAGAFDLAYRRFEDLKLKEQQYREAEIELALERVRARTMAMQRSEDLADLSFELVKQVQALGVATWFCAFNIYDEDGKGSLEWGSNGEGVFPLYRTPREGIFLRYYEAGQRGETLLVHEIGEDECPAHYAYLCTLPGVGEQLLKMKDAGIPFPTSQIDHVAYFKYGYLIFITYEPVPESHDIFKRFARVFEQTYTRFLDLQRAEAQAREAVRQASLDRVRAEIASMRTTADLDRITPLLWRELTTLGVPFIRCGVFIADEAARHFRTHLGRPDGAALAAFDLPFDSAPTTRALAEHWRAAKVYREQWDRAQFVDWMRSMAEQGILDDAAYPGAEDPPEALALLFAPFAQGMLYVGSPAPLSDDDVAVVRSLAEAFAVAYARYEDFRKLEAAKRTVEAAYDELNEAKDRLVQSEKLASLGALTAGIAHEIKNPLNFINNFAELNEELADEVAEALDAGDLDEVRAILDDVRQNAAIIKQHGKRADGIVRSMMQHARSGEGRHEPVDVNAFVEEYLNLAYHGQRARVPGFNAELVTELGDDVGTVEMVPQEMGRVLINLLGNAFDAVCEYAASQNGQYAPKVTVTTRRENGQVAIRVADNGPGIPDEVKAKIFEPFFTTKPTGSGTGLGLSLSHDIVTQGHGGTLTVESAPGQGATFVVRFPSHMVPVPPH
ncbi:MAG: hypothetical protein D6746_11110 [Bacteroidetes bacterium]|nr:MAG: hypothetical protein D6746_11110 [Bacteroidota bacterium]